MIKSKWCSNNFKNERFLRSHPLVCLLFQGLVCKSIFKLLTYRVGGTGHFQETYLNKYMYVYTVLTRKRSVLPLLSLASNKNEKIKIIGTYAQCNTDANRISRVNGNYNTTMVFFKSVRRTADDFQFKCDALNSADLEKYFLLRFQTNIKSLLIYCQSCWRVKGLIPFNDFGHKKKNKNTFVEKALPK